MVDSQCAGEALGACLALGDPLERVRVTVRPQGGDGLRQLLVASTENGDGRRPGDAVSGTALGPQMSAEGEEAGEVGDGVYVPKRGNPDQSVRVQVVTEQDAGVVVYRREEARSAVVEEIALVDRLEPDGEPLVGERRENGQLLTLGSGPKSVAPERALPPCLHRDRLPDPRGYYSHCAMSFAQ